eukprot:Clim_evm26s168 gene=Clim_evmTU26s168
MDCTEANYSSSSTELSRKRRPNSGDSNIERGCSGNYESTSVGSAGSSRSVNDRQQGRNAMAAAVGEADYTPVTRSEPSIPTVSSQAPLMAAYAPPEATFYPGRYRNFCNYRG